MTNLTQFDFSSIRAVVSDMDGVIWRGNFLLPGVPDFFVYLKEIGIPYMLATNNSSKSIEDYVTRIEPLGIPIDGQHILTSGLVTADELRRTYPIGTPIYVIGGDGLKTLLTSAGYPLDHENAQAVIVGLDININYEKLMYAGRRIIAGAEFIGTNGDFTFPVADGIAPGNGSIIAALEAMTGKKARFMGKPEPAMFRSAVERLGYAPEQILMIGDRMDTDILGAKLAGLKAVLVLSGVSDESTIGQIPPDGIFRDLGDLHTHWRESLKIS